MQRTRAQRPQPDATELEIRPLQGERRLTLARHALGDEQADRFLGQPARDELEHERRRRIQPLHVVDRHEHASLSGQPPKDAQTRSRDRPLIRRRPLLLRQQERRLERPPLDRGQRLRAPRRAPVRADRPVPRTRAGPRSRPGGRRARALLAREPVPPRPATPSSCRFPPRPRARAPRESRRRQRRRRRQAPRPCRRPRGEWRPRPCGLCHERAPQLNTAIWLNRSLEQQTEPEREARRSVVDLTPQPADQRGATAARSSSRKLVPGTGLKR